MAHLIDKDALIAEVKRLIAFYSKEIEDNKEDPWAMDIAKRDILQEILSFIDTLEVKEVTSIELLKVKGFLVTDKDDYTAIYSTKPNRGRTEWVDGNHPRNANESSCLMTLNNARLLPDIKFNDKPIEVEVVIKAQKGE